MSPEVTSSTSETSRHVVTLNGCRPTPLASYLKALGILRLVAEQKDSTALGWWEDDVFQLDSRLNRDQLAEFFLEEYSPTPIVGPWNGGSGFYPKDNTEAFDPIRDGGADRYASMRSTIIQLERLIAKKGLTKRPDPGAAKSGFLTELRGIASDRFLRWMDAAVALNEDEALYPPLLGTGGNDGRLDFTNNFMKNLVRLFNPDTGHASDVAAELLADALFDKSVPGLQDSPIGQFAPGAAGGPNSVTGFSGGGQVNPWDFIMMLEGSILLAASTVRRLESRGKGVLAYPFTVRSTGAGSGSTAIGDTAPARAESWMPLWGRPATVVEIGHVLNEGRIVVNQRMSGDGLDAIRALGKLGADRGIDSLQRFGYLQRAGLAYLATPLGRSRVQRNPDVDLIDELDHGGWLTRFRRLGGAIGAPARLDGLLHRLEDSLFELARSAGSAGPVQRCLAVLGECQRYLARSPAARESCPPVPALGEEWVARANDGSPEFLIAAGLASLRGRTPVGDAGGEVPKSRIVLATAEYMAPIRDGRSRSWSDGSNHRVVWSGGPLGQNLGRMMVRRMLDQNELRLAELPLRSVFQNDALLSSNWLQHPEWDRRVSQLIEGLALVRRFPIHHGTENAMSNPIPAAFALLKAFFVPDGQLVRVVPLRSSGIDGELLPQPAEIVRLLRADQRDRAVAMAVRILRSRGFTAPRVVPLTATGSGPRLLGALMVPITDGSLRKLLNSLFEDEASRSTPANSTH